MQLVFSVRLSVLTSLTEKVSEKGREGEREWSWKELVLMDCIGFRSASFSCVNK